jgi:hypothetical protein
MNHRQQAREQMRRDIYAAIHRNLVSLNVTISRHEVVEILTGILAGQIQIIQHEARKQRAE